jgi:hypothetical protein
VSGDHQLPRSRATSPFALVSVALLAVALGGCSNKAQVFQDSNEGGFFSKPVDIFAKPSWARPSITGGSLGPSGPVGAENLVSADGSCAPAAAEASQAAAPAPQPAQQPAASGGQGAGFEGGLEPGAGGPGSVAPPVLGGVALGMSECDAVRRAGHPSNVAIGAGGGGERKVVLTYLEGPWPGIYTFSDGRLKEVDAVPEPEKPKVPAKKKKKPVKRAKTASGPERAYVQ